MFLKKNWVQLDLNFAHKNMVPAPFDDSFKIFDKDPFNFCIWIAPPLVKKDLQKRIIHDVIK